MESRIVDEFHEIEFFKKGIKEGLERVYSRQICVLFKIPSLNQFGQNQPVFYSREGSRLFKLYLAHSKVWCFLSNFSKNLKETKEILTEKKKEVGMP